MHVSHLRGKPVRKVITILTYAAATCTATTAFVLVAAHAVVWTQEMFKSGPVLFEDLPPRVGDMAPDFTLKDLEGKPVRLSDWRGRSPVVLEFGSFT